jgi:hypothetical protein
MKRTLIQNAVIVNEGRKVLGSVVELSFDSC